MRMAKFDLVRVAELHVNFRELSIEVKASLIDSKTNAPMAWVPTARTLSTAAREKLGELRQILEAELDAHYFDTGEQQQAVGVRVPPEAATGLGENFGDGIPPG